MYVKHIRTPWVTYAGHHYEAASGWLQIYIFQQRIKHTRHESGGGVGLCSAVESNDCWILKDLTGVPAVLQTETDKLHVRDTLQALERQLRHDPESWKAQKVSYSLVLDVRGSKNRSCCQEHDHRPGDQGEYSQAHLGIAQHTNFSLTRIFQTGIRDSDTK